MHSIKQDRAQINVKMIFKDIFTKLTIEQLINHRALLIAIDGLLITIVITNQESHLGLDAVFIITLKGILVLLVDYQRIFTN